VETDRFDQDPATRIPPMPKLQPIKELIKLNPVSDEARFLKTSLTRRRNELLNSLNQAISEIQETINLL
jgi:hypothetical protein